MQINADSSTVETDGLGVQTQRHIDGTVVVVQKDGSRVQTNADGTRIEIAIDGVSVQIKGDVKVTTYTDGSKKQEDMATGVVIESTQDRSTQTNPDGSLIESVQGKMVRQVSAQGEEVLIE